MDGAAKEPVVNRFDRAAFDGIEIEYRVHGVGEPVVLVHAGVFADWFEPLINEPALANRYRVVSYHRIGYAGSSDVAGPVNIAQQAVHLRSLMDTLGIERAHLVGHSSGGIIALQLALDAPGRVQSLSLLEPAVPVGPGRTQSRPPVRSRARSGVVAAIEFYRAGDKARSSAACAESACHGRTPRCVLCRTFAGGERGRGRVTATRLAFLGLQPKEAI